MARRPCPWSPHARMLWPGPRGHEHLPNRPPASQGQGVMPAPLDAKFAQPLARRLSEDFQVGCKVTRHPTITFMHASEAELAALIHYFIDSNGFLIQSSPKI